MIPAGVKGQTDTEPQEGVVYTITDEGKASLKSCDKSKEGEFSIPATITHEGKDYTVTKINGFAFSDCILTAIVVPNSVETILDYAFIDCKHLTKVTIGSGVKVLPTAAFEGATALTAIEVDVANTVFSSEGGVLFDANKQVLVCYPAGKSGRYDIPSSVTEIKTVAFNGCVGLTEVMIPNQVSQIGANPFSETGLTKVAIPNSVTNIVQFAFLKCSALTEVVIGNGITEIGQNALWECPRLVRVEVHATTPPTMSGEEVFTEGCVIYVPFGCGEAYRGAQGWLAYTIKELPEGAQTPSDPPTEEETNPVSSTSLSWRVGVDGRTVTGYGAEGARLEVYNVSGVRVHRVAGMGGSQYRVDLPQAGVYVVRVGNGRRKVVVQ